MDEQRQAIINRITFWVAIAAIMVIAFVLLWTMIIRPSLNTCSGNICSLNETLPDVCITVEPIYTMNCYNNGTFVKVNGVTASQLSLAETKYNCTIESTSDNFNMLYCSTPTNETKYQVVLKAYS